MNPVKVRRDRLVSLTDLPNVGRATAQDLEMLGIHKPLDLIGCDPVQMYHQLCQLTGVKQDPCVLDVFLSVVKFMEGEPAQVWWAYTDQRKRIAGFEEETGR